MNRTVATVIALPALLLVGCASGHETLLLDGHSSLKYPVHYVPTVADPFAATSRPDAIPVFRGIAPGASNTTTAKKCTFYKTDGFFKVPASDTVEVRLAVAATSLRDLRVEVRAISPAASQSCRVTLEPGRWQDISIVLDPARFKPGAAVHDVTVSLLGQDPSAGLYVRRLAVRAH